MSPRVRPHSSTRSEKFPLSFTFHGTRERFAFEAAGVLWEAGRASLEPRDIEAGASWLIKSNPP